MIPPAVANEFTRIISKAKLPPWIRIQQLSDRSSSQVQLWVEKDYADLGECEAIGLALQENSDWLLTDDTEARQFAEHLGLEVHGSIGLLLWATASGHVSSREQAHQLLNGLERSSLWISERVLREAAKAIDQLISE